MGKRIILMLVVAFILAVSAQAATIMQTQYFDFQGEVETLSFDKFDPNLGTLVGVVYTGLTSMYAYNAQLTAALASPGTCRASAELVLEYTIKGAVEDIFSQSEMVVLECWGDLYGCDDQIINFAEPFNGSKFESPDAFVGPGAITMTPMFSVVVVSTSSVNAHITEVGAVSTWTGRVTLQYTYVPGCSWDVEPAPEGDGDVDGSDLAEFAGREFDETEISAFTVQFGRTDCF